jgi:hypothetical protein
MEDERPFATKHPRESSESTTIDMEDELHCLYASAHYPTDYRKQREAESSGSRDMLTTATRSKLIYVRRHNHRRVRSYRVLRWVVSFSCGNHAYLRLKTDHQLACPQSSMAITGCVDHYLPS